MSKHEEPDSEDHREIWAAMSDWEFARAVSLGAKPPKSMMNRRLRMDRAREENGRKGELTNRPPSVS